MTEIKIIIGKGGKVSLNVEGVTGPSCRELTRRLEEAMGRIESVKKKGAFYEQTQAVNQQQKLGGANT